VAVSVDLLPGFLAYNATYEAPPAEPAILARLPRDERVVVDVKSDYYGLGVANYLMMYGLSTPSGYVSQYPRIYQELVDAIGGIAVDHGVDWSAKEERALKLLNVRVLVTRDGSGSLTPNPPALDSPSRCARAPSVLPATNPRRGLDTAVCGFH
jgi:hypothetical protein